MLLYYLALPFIYFISLLPFRLLYLFSDFMYLLLFYVVGYRKKVVEENLRNSFPEKSAQELKQLSKKYYHYLCDLTLESLKKITINEKVAQERCTFKSVELIERLRKENKSIMLLMGHYGNWEWAGSSFSLLKKHQLFVVYKPLSSKYFEELMRRTRTMFGTRLIKMENTLRDIINNKNNLAAYAFIADQTPPPNIAYWTKFLHQDTAMYTGAEKLAKKLNFPVVFINIVRVKRGYYEIYAEMLCEDPKTSKENEITDKYIEKLEVEIKKMPETWLWSHRRWKHKRPEGVK